MQLVYITCSGVKEAKKIALALLKKRLIACANIVPQIDSFYWWNGKIERAHEVLLLCKSGKRLARAVEREVKKIHSYNVPCIEFISVGRQNKECAQWVKKVFEQK